MDEKIRVGIYVTQDTKDKMRKYSYLSNKKYVEFMDEILNKELTKLINELEEN